MKKTFTNAWHALGSTGRMILALTLFYFIAKTLKH